MPSYEENMQKVLDLRAQVLNTEIPDPEPKEIWLAVQALHETRGVKAAKKKADVPVIHDLKSLFK